MVNFLNKNNNKYMNSNVDISKLITYEDLKTLQNFYNTCHPYFESELNSARIMFEPAVQFKAKVDKGYNDGIPMDEAKITRAILDKGNEKLTTVPVEEAYQVVVDFLDRFTQLQQLSDKIEKLFNKINVVLEA